MIGQYKLIRVNTLVMTNETYAVFLRYYGIQLYWNLQFFIYLLCNKITKVITVLLRNKKRYVFSTLCHIIVLIYECYINLTSISYGGACNPYSLMASWQLNKNYCVREKS